MKEVILTTTIPRPQKMQNDSKAGTVVVPPTANAKKSVNDVTVMATPEFFIVLANLAPISSRVLLLRNMKKY